MFVTCLGSLLPFSFSISLFVENRLKWPISKNPAPTNPVRLHSRSRCCERRQLKQGTGLCSFPLRWFWDTWCSVTFCLFSQSLVGLFALNQKATFMDIFVCFNLCFWWHQHVGQQWLTADSHKEIYIVQVSLCGAHHAVRQPELALTRQSVWQALDLRLLFLNVGGQKRPRSK